MICYLQCSTELVSNGKKPNSFRVFLIQIDCCYKKGCNAESISSTRLNKLDITENLGLVIIFTGFLFNLNFSRKGFKKRLIIRDSQIKRNSFSYWEDIY